MKTWVERYIEWGLNRAERPWAAATAKQYERDLRSLERFTTKPAEDAGPEDLRSFQAGHRGERPNTWNARHGAITGFFRFLGAQGYFQDLDAHGRHRSDPSTALTRRTNEPRTGRPNVDVHEEIASIGDETYKRIALFLYHSGLKIGAAVSISEPPVAGKLHVVTWGGGQDWVPVRPEALDLLEQLGGRIPRSRRAIQRALPVKPSEIEAASRRDHQLRSAHTDALGPVWALLVGRQDLIDVARAYRDAVEALEDPKPRPKAAITAAARALQAMLVAIGARGNSLGPLFDSARSKGLFQPYDAKLILALQSLVDWVSADRVERGDAHKDTDAGLEDAWLAVRIVGALLLRLEASTH